MRQDQAVPSNLAASASLLEATANGGGYISNFQTTEIVQTRSNPTPFPRRS